MWAVHPEDMCEKVLGRPWKEVKMEIDADPKKSEAFKRQNQIAGYLVAQIELFALMCAGRSNNCISWFEKSFEFETLVSLMFNPYLPSGFRSAASSLVQTLYLDRYPQVPTMGKDLWIYEMKRGGGNRGGGSRQGGKGNADDDDGDDSTEGLPLIRPGLKLEDPEAMPAFSIPTGHPLRSHVNPFFSFHHHTKFFLLRHFCSTLLGGGGKGGAVVGGMVHANTEKNALVLKAVEITQALLTYGFQSTITKVEALVPVIVSILDGRNEPEKLLTSGRDAAAVPIPFSPLEARFDVTTTSPLVTKTKTAAISVLLDVANLRANFRLAKLLERFKELNSIDIGRRELVIHGAFSVAGKESKYPGFLTNQLFEQFEALFTTADGVRMDLSNLSGIDCETVLLDCLM
jgi:hypothetical protein